MKTTEIFAHRGASGYESEIPWRLCTGSRTGADGIELDVQLSRDGQMVIIHDENVDRVCNGTGWVKDYTLEELKRFQVSTPEGKREGFLP